MRRRLRRGTSRRGDGGEQLHAWFADDCEVASRSHATVRAIVCGRRTYDDSLPWWGPDGPSGDARIPVVVVTRGRTPAPEGSVYTFVTAAATHVRYRVIVP